MSEKTEENKLDPRLEKLFLSGSNILLTGQAGTGKTTSINWLIDKYGDDYEIAIKEITGILEIK
jgi:type IV secretory pathway ATPase VirB11/archaellum biosynthesis ATPase